MAARVSIVLATFNGSRYLREQLASILAQTHPAYEIVISDDGSSDQTLEIISEFQRNNTNVIFRRNSRPLGFGENFLSAAMLASGDLIAFCDQDDIWDIDKLRLCVGHFLDQKLVLVVHRATLIDGEGNALGKFDQGIQRLRLTPPLSHRPWETFYGFSMVFRSSLLSAFNPAERGIDYITGRELLAHDRWIMFLASLLGYTAELPLELVQYRQHGSNLFGAGVGRKIPPKLLRSGLAARSQLYLNAAERFLELIANADVGRLGYMFPFSSLISGREFWEKVAHQQRWRAKYGRSLTVYSRAQVLYNAVSAGAYNRAVGRGIDWRALIRDLSVII